MQQTDHLSESALACEALKRLSEDRSILYRAAQVLELVAHSGVGLGEVLQDYAHQAAGQVKSVMHAGRNLEAGIGPEDAEAVENIPLVLKAVKSVLEMTPGAMQRNKAESLGEKEKLSRAAVAALMHDFVHSFDVARLLAENAGQLLAGAMPQGRAEAAPQPAQDQADADARH